MESRHPDKLSFVFGPFIGMLIATELCLVLFFVIFTNYLQKIEISFQLNLVINVIFVLMILLGLYFGYHEAKKRGLSYKVFSLRKENVSFMIAFGIAYLIAAVLQKGMILSSGRFVPISELNIFEGILAFVTTSLFFYPFASIFTYLWEYFKAKHKSKLPLKDILTLIGVLIILNPFFIQLGYSSTGEYQIKLAYKECGIILTKLDGSVFSLVDLTEKSEIDYINGIKITDVKTFKSTILAQKDTFTIGSVTDTYYIPKEKLIDIKNDLTKIEISQKMCKNG